MNGVLSRRVSCILMAGLLLLLVACVETGNPSNTPRDTVAETVGIEDLPEMAQIEAQRVQPSDVGPVYVTGELLIALRSDTADPQERIEVVASEFGGTVVGSVPRLLLYQVRFGDEELQELRALRDEIIQLPDIGSATVHYLMEWDTDL